jgi:hypothetical protein
MKKHHQGAKHKKIRKEKNKLLIQDDKSDKATNREILESNKYAVREDSENEISEEEKDENCENHDNHEEKNEQLKIIQKEEFKFDLKLFMIVSRF